LQQGTEVGGGQNISGYCNPPNWPTRFFANFDQIFQKLLLIQGMTKKVLCVYVDQCLESLPHLIKIPTLPPPHL